MTATDDLLNLLRRELIAYDNSRSVSAEILADEAFKKIDPDEMSPPLAAWSCVLNLRQMSRQLLRREYEPQPEESGQISLFDGLQERYPGVGDHKGVYVPRMQMSYADRMHNIRRLRKEAEAKLAHADALEAETEKLKSLGFWSEEGLCA